MPSHAQPIRFHFLVPPFYFSKRTLLKQFVLNQLRKAGKEVEAINYIFCDDAYLLNLNQSFLKHNTYTDIITFELSEKGEPLLADIYISIERVRANAEEFGQPFIAELLRVVFHGALHLYGYKDKTKAESRLMREAENLWLQNFSVSRETNAQ